MTTDKRLGEAISLWLEADAPGQLPDRVLGATFERTRTTRQQVGWRAILGRPHMARLVPALGSAAVVTAAVIIGALVLVPGSNRPNVGGHPTAPPSAAVFPSQLSERFESSAHGISISHPSGWETRAASEPWGHDAIAFDAPGVDVIFDPRLGDDLWIAIVSEPLGGLSADEWRTDLRAVTKICSEGEGGAAGAILVDGVSAWGESCGGLPAASHQAFVAKDGRGYVIRLYDAGRSSTAGEWFDAVLDTVDLLPDPVR